MTQGRRARHAQKKAQRDLPAYDAEGRQQGTAQKKRPRLARAQTADLPAQQQIREGNGLSRGHAEISEPDQRISIIRGQLHGVGVHKQGKGDEKHGPAHQRGVHRVGSQPAKGHLAQSHGNARPQHDQPPGRGRGQQKGEQQAGIDRREIIHRKFAPHDLLAESLHKHGCNHAQGHDPRGGQPPVADGHDGRRHKTGQHVQADLADGAPAVPVGRGAHGQKHGRGCCGHHAPPCWAALALPEAAALSADAERSSSSFAAASAWASLCLDSRIYCSTGRRAMQT